MCRSPQRLDHRTNRDRGGSNQATHPARLCSWNVLCRSTPVPAWGHFLKNEIAPLNTLPDLLLQYWGHWGHFSCRFVRLRLKYSLIDTGS